MKMLSTLCSIFLLGTLFSGVSMGMDTDEKDLFIHGHTKPSDLIEEIRSGALNCNDLRVEIKSSITEKRVDGNSEDSSDDERLMGVLLRDLMRRPEYTYHHGVYSLRDAIREIKGTDGSIQPSLQHIHFINKINRASTIEEELMEGQKGPMVCALFNLLQICPNVESLSLEFLTVNPAGIHALRETPRFSFLKGLTIQYAHMGDDAVAMLFASPHPHLEYLDFSFNQITGAGFSVASLPSLRVLNLWNNKIGNEGLLEITRSHSPLLQTLSLGGNEISVEGLRMAYWGDRELQILLLDHNPIGDEGALFLGSQGYLKTLKVLGLTYSQIGKKGLNALANSSINIIFVKGANILEEEKKEFYKNLLFGCLSYQKFLPTLDRIKTEYRHMF